MNDEKFWHESIDDLAIDINGVKNFHYPIPPGDTIHFREILGLRLVNFYRELKIHENSYIDECVASLFGLINESTNIFYTTKLKKKLDEKNYKILPDQKSRLLKKIITNEIPENPKILKQLITGKERTKKRFLIPRVVRDILTEKNIKKFYFRSPDLKKDILTISIDPFLENHAKIEEKKVYYIRINKWFKNLTKPYGKKNDLNYVCANILNIIFQEFEKNEIFLNHNLKTYFKEMVKSLLVNLSIHKRSILEAEIGLPKTLWTPSGGGIFANIFRQVCKSNGSRVVGHAHGSGTGFFSDYGRTMSILEYQSCTDFIVYTSKSVEEYRRFSRRDLLIDNKLPNIKSIEGNNVWPYDKLSKFQSLIKRDKKEKYILYIPSIFIYDNYFDGNLLDAHTTYDWLIKISNFLKKNKFNFKIKLHPKRKAPLKFLKKFSDNISHKNLAKSIDDCSLIITDQPSSTSFSASVVSNKPIIFIDLNVQEFTNFSWILLKKRCKVLSAEITRNGINLDWSALMNSILFPKKDFDQDFKLTYFENVSI